MTRAKGNVQGKTSLLKALQKQLQEPYLDMGIDKFIWMLLGRYLDRLLWDDVLGKALLSGPLGLTLFSGMHHAIAATAQQRVIERLKSPPTAFKKLR